MLFTARMIQVAQLGHLVGRSWKTVWQRLAVELRDASTRLAYISLVNYLYIRCFLQSFSSDWSVALDSTSDTSRAQ